MNDTFVCRQCGNCCRVEGRVLLREGEIETIAAHLEMDIHAFTEDYTLLSADRRGLCLTETNDGTCVFLTTANRCRIHAVKPRQCRDFPSRWRYPDTERPCADSRA